MARDRGRMVDQGAVRHRDALGAAGRPGGVDQVGDVLRVGQARRVRGRRPGDGRPVAIEPHQLRTALGQPVDQVRLGQQDRHPCIGEHERQPLGRVGRIHRHVGAASLEHGQQRDGHLDRALDAQPDQHLRPDPARPQVVGELVRARVQLPVAQPLLAVDDRDRVRAARGLGLDEILDAGRARAVGRGRVPLDEHALALGRRQERQVVEPLIRVGQHPLEHCLQVREDARAGVGREAGSVEGDLEREPGAGVGDHLERVVGPAAAARAADLEPGPVSTGDPVVPGALGRVVLDDDDALEERLAARDVAPALQLDQRAVLVFALSGLGGL